MWAHSTNSSVNNSGASFTLQNWCKWWKPKLRPISSSIKHVSPYDLPIYGFFDSTNLIHDQFAFFLSTECSCHIPNIPTVNWAKLFQSNMKAYRKHIYLSPVLHSANVLILWYIITIWHWKQHQPSIWPTKCSPSNILIVPNIQATQTWSFLPIHCCQRFSLPAFETIFSAWNNSGASIQMLRW